MQIRIITNKTLVIATYSFYVFWRILALSTMPIDLPVIYSLLSGFVKGLFVLCIIISLVKKRITIREAFVYSILLVVCILIVFWNGYSQLLFLALLIILCREVEFAEIVNASLVVQTLAFALIMALSQMGLIRDLVYNHVVHDAFVFRSAQVHTFGFIYYTTPAYLLLSIMIEWFYLKKDKVNVITYAIWITIHMIAYRVYSSRACLILALLFMIMAILMKKVDLQARIWHVIATLSYAFMTLASIVFVYGYTSNNKYVLLVDSVISGRFRYAARAFVRYGVSLFGRTIPMTGGYEYTYLGADDYFYIDSGFIYCLLCYGIIMTIVILFSYSIIFERVTKDGDVYMYLWLFIYMIMNATNNTLVSIQFNPALLMLPYAILKHGRIRTMNRHRMRYFDRIF